MHSIFWFRTRQWVLSRVLHLTEHKKQTLLAAPDAVLLLPALFRKRRISRILLVTTPGFVRRGTLTSLLDGCKKENISVTIFSEIAPDPQIESVEQGFRLYQQIQAQAILAIGGGSVLDAAKLIGARVCCPKKTVPAMRGLLKVRRKLPPLFAVPTTAGTGSEATAAAVITDCIDGKPYKYAVNDLCLIPDTAVLDPRLTISLPSSMTADTGMDALTHAMEAFLNLFASAACRMHPSRQSAKISMPCPKPGVTAPVLPHGRKCFMHRIWPVSLLPTTLSATSMPLPTPSVHCTTFRTEEPTRFCCLLFCANTVPALRLNLPFSPMRFLSAEIPFLKRLSG